MKKFLGRIGLLCAGLAVLAPGLHPAAADPPQGKGYVPAFDDEFTGTSLDTAKWDYNYPWGHLHNGRAAMEPSQVEVGGGVLDLQAVWQTDPNISQYTHDQFGDWSGGYYDTGKNSWFPIDFTSGTIYSKQRWQYGYFEGRFMVPWQNSAWPAFWMLQDGWPPELDIFEFHGSHTSENYTYHFTSGGGNASWGGVFSGPDMHADWHTFGVDWQPDHLTYYVDGQAINTFTDTAAIAQMGPMYFLLDHQIGGWAPDPVKGNGEYNDLFGNSWSGDFQADWVKVWQVGGPANGVYRITPKNAPDKALGVSPNPDGSWNYSNGAGVSILAAGSGPIQQWAVARQPDGSYTLRSYSGYNWLNKDLDVAGWGTGSGTPLDIWDAGNANNQKFYLQDTGGGWYRISPKIAGDQTMDILGASTADGATVQTWQWYSDAEPQQLWHLDPAGLGAMQITNIAAAPVTATQATITWSSNYAADTAVSYGPTVSYGASAAGPGGVTAHSAAISGLMPGTTYHYRVFSKTAFGQTISGGDQMFVTTAPALTLSSPSASPISDTSATLHWVSSNVADTTVNYGLTSSYGSVATGPSGVTTHSVALSGLTPGTTYHYQVVSRDAYGQAQSSPDAAFVSAPKGSPRVMLRGVALAREAGTGDILATVTLANGGSGDAVGVRLTSALLGATGTTTAMPATIGICNRGATTTLVLRFAGVPSSQPLLFRLSGSCVGSAFSGSGTVNTPL